MAGEVVEEAAGAVLWRCRLEICAAFSMDHDLTLNILGVAIGGRVT
jgi:hypothetical protein